MQAAPHARHAPLQQATLSTCASEWEGRRPSARERNDRLVTAHCQAPVAPLRLLQLPVASSVVVSCVLPPPFPSLAMLDELSSWCGSLVSWLESRPAEATWGWYVAALGGMYAWATLILAGQIRTIGGSKGINPIQVTRETEAGGGAQDRPWPMRPLANRLTSLLCFAPLPSCSGSSRSTARRFPDACPFLLSAILAALCIE